MRRIRSSRTLLGTAIAVTLLTTASFAPSASASPEGARRPVIIDSQGGIDNGQSGTVLRTGPLSWEPIVGARPIAAPVELAPPESSMPVVVSPYIQLPTPGRKHQRMPPSSLPLPQ